MQFYSVESVQYWRSYNDTKTLEQISVSVISSCQHPPGEFFERAKTPPAEQINTTKPQPMGQKLMCKKAQKPYSLCETRMTVLAEMVLITQKF